MAHIVDSTVITANKKPNPPAVARDSWEILGLYWDNGK